MPPIFCGKKSMFAFKQQSFGGSAISNFRSAIDLAKRHNLSFANRRRELIHQFFCQDRIVINVFAVNQMYHEIGVYCSHCIDLTPFSDFILSAPLSRIAIHFVFHEPFHFNYKPGFIHCNPRILSYGMTQFSFRYNDVYYGAATMSCNTLHEIAQWIKPNKNAQFVAQEFQNEIRPIVGDTTRILLADIYDTDAILVLTSAASLAS